MSVRGRDRSALFAQMEIAGSKLLATVFGDEALAGDSPDLDEPPTTA